MQPPSTRPNVPAFVSLLLNSRDQLLEEVEQIISADMLLQMRSNPALAPTSVSRVGSLVSAPAGAKLKAIVVKIKTIDANLKCYCTV